MSYEFYEHKRRDRFKWIIAFGAIILLAVFVLAANTNGFTNADPYGWFTEDETTATDGTPNTDNGDTIPNAEIPDPDGMELPDGSETEEDNSPIKVVNSDLMKMTVRGADIPEAQRDDWIGAYEIIAYVEPENCVDYTVAWEIQWENPNSEWASGKEVTDYVRLVDDGNPMARRAICYISFGEEITVSAYVVENASARAICTLGFAQRFGEGHEQKLVSAPGLFNDLGEIEGIVQSEINIIKPASVTEMVDMYFIEGNIDFVHAYANRPYTVASPVLSVSYNIEPNLDFRDMLENYGFERPRKTSFTLTELNFAEIINTIVGEKILPTDYTDTVDYNKVNAFNQACAEYDGDHAFCIEVYIESEYITDQVWFWIWWDSDSLSLMPTALELDQGFICF